MANSTPYRCVPCMAEEGCGYHGQLVFEGYKPPLCKHNEKPGKPCHANPVRMTPVKTVIVEGDGG